MENRIIIAGSGGQGILFFGKLLASAAIIEKKDVTWFPSYGAEIRGGTANCTVIIADKMIGSPIIKKADYLIALNEASYDKYLTRLDSGGCVLFDSTLILDRLPVDKQVALPASEISAEAGQRGLANMVLAGAFCAASGIFSLDSLLVALDTITPARRRNLLEINKAVIRKGYLYAQDKTCSNC